MRRLALVGLVLVAVGCGRAKQKDYSVSSLIESLKDTDPAVRYTAADVLGRYGAQAREAVPALITSIKDEDKNVRIGVVYALANIGADAKEAVPALQEALNDQDASVRKGAAYALKEIQNPSPRPPRDKAGKKKRN